MIDLERGYLITEFPLSALLKRIVETDAWPQLDEYFKLQTAHGGELFKFLRQWHEFNSIEFIISIRDAQNDWEEDGIWHDDGSRLMAFSLSLTLNPIEGGNLGIRKKGQLDMEMIATPEFGKIIVFLTGQYGFEHKIHRVTQGRRVIIAGWCS